MRSPEIGVYLCRPEKNILLSEQFGINWIAMGKNKNES